MAAAASAQSITVSFPASRSDKPLDGRLLLLLSNDPSAEPRMQIDDTPKSQMIFGVTVDGWKPGEPLTIGDNAQGYPRAKSEGRAARRVYGPGRAEHLRDLSPVRRQDREARAGSRRRPALEPRAGQSAVEAALGSHRSRGATHRGLAR